MQVKTSEYSLNWLIDINKTSDYLIKRIDTVRRYLGPVMLMVDR